MPFPLLFARVMIAPVNVTLVVASVADPQFRKSPFCEVIAAMLTAPDPKIVSPEELLPKVMVVLIVRAKPAVFTVSKVVPDVSFKLAMVIALVNLTVNVPLLVNCAISVVPLLPGYPDPTPQLAGVVHLPPSLAPPVQV